MLLLLQHGADPNIPTQPLPPLIAAARAGDVELARLLLHFGADPNIRIPRELVMMSKVRISVTTPTFSNVSIIQLSTWVYKGN